MLAASHYDRGIRRAARLLTTGLNIKRYRRGRQTEGACHTQEGIDEASELGAVGFAFLSGKYEERKKEEAVPGAGEINQRTLCLCQIERRHQDCSRGL